MSTTLVLTMVTLLLILMVLVFLYVWIGRSHEEKRPPEPKIETFETLSAVVNNPASTNGELSRAVTLLINSFIRIDSHKAGAYMRLLETLCTHPHTDSKLVLRFEKALREANPSHTAEIKHALNVGLAARG